MSLAVDGSASFSLDRVYRYHLWRRLKREGCGSVAFIGLNPSTADEQKDDPTVRRCIGFARAWGYDRVEMLNLFAFRAKDPREMYAAVGVSFPVLVSALLAQPPAAPG